MNSSKANPRASLPSTISFVIVLRHQRGNTKRFKWQDRSTKLTLYKNPRHHAHSRSTADSGSSSAQSPTCLACRPTRTSEYRVKLAARRIAGGETTLPA